MNKKEIAIGGIYSNKKGAIRKVIDIGPQYKLYEGQAEEDCLLYEQLEGKKLAYSKGTSEDGNQLNHSTISSFASWAKQKLENG